VSIKFITKLKTIYKINTKNTITLNESDNCAKQSKTNTVMEGTTQQTNNKALSVITRHIRYLQNKEIQKQDKTKHTR